MAVGQLVKVSPDLTGLQDWIVGRVIKIRQNPFLGLEIAAQDSNNAIYFGEAKYFKLA